MNPTVYQINDVTGQRRQLFQVILWYNIFAVLNIYSGIYFKDKDSCNEI